MLNKKKYFPTVVDNFFDKPDKIREFALGLEYKPDPLGRWPGLRTEFLHKIDLELSTAIMLKILAVYHDFAFQNVKWTDSIIMFNKIKDNGDDELNKGWIHIDQKYELFGLCYLNPGVNNMDWGTSIYTRKKDFPVYIESRHHYKHMFFKGEELDIEQYKKSLNDHTSGFDETVKIGNVYNRLVSYSGAEAHRMNALIKGEERLTMLMFCNGIQPEANRFPANRVRDKVNYDNFIYDTIDSLNAKNIKK